MVVHPPPLSNRPFLRVRLDCAGLCPTAGVGQPARGGSPLRLFLALRPTLPVRLFPPLALHASVPLPCGPSSAGFREDRKHGRGAVWEAGELYEALYDRDTCLQRALWRAEGPLQVRGYGWQGGVTVRLQATASAHCFLLACT